MPLHLVEQLLAQIVGFQQMAEAAHRRLVRHRLAAEINPDEIAHGQRIVEHLFHRRVRQGEPLLQEIDPQHPLAPDRGGGHCRLWDRTARSARTAPATAPPVPSRPAIPPAASSWRSVQTPPPPASSASSPPTYARQSTPPRIISRSLAEGFCRGSLGGPNEGWPKWAEDRASQSACVLVIG